jgi:glycosyltransferase involved in cell wall biosynthesis
VTERIEVSKARNGRNMVFVMNVSHFPRGGGFERVVYLLSQELAREGFGVEVLCESWVNDAHQGATRPVGALGFYPRLWNTVYSWGEPKEETYFLFETAWTAPSALASKVRGMPTVMHLHALESQPGFGWGEGMRYYVASLESMGARFSDLLLTVSLDERKILSSRFKRKRVEYLPLPVDVHPQAATNVKRKLINEIRGKLGLDSEAIVVSFLGGMDYPPNRVAAEFICTRVLPLVLNASARKVLFLLIGKSPPASAFTSKNVRATGYVESFSEWLMASDLALAPVFGGGGVKTKVLDYLSCGLPVIATSKAVEGTALSPWEHYAPAETDREFAQRILGYLRGDSVYDAMAEEGFKYVCREHASQAVVGRLAHMLESI